MNDKNQAIYVIIENYKQKRLKTIQMECYCGP
jgi:hypothetical protein